MRIFNLPFVRPIDDKVFGGVLNFKQGMFIMSSVVLFVVLFLYSSETNEADTADKVNWIMITLKIIFFIAYTSFMIILSFVKKREEMSMDEYLIELLRFHIRNNTITYNK